MSKTSLASALQAEDSSMDFADCKHFASRVVDAFSSARAIDKSMTSGKKTGPGMKALVEALKGHQAPGKALSVHSSDSPEISDSEPVVALTAALVDSFQNALCRKYPGQSVQVANMSPGENGFGIANFMADDGGPAEQKQTEIPNLMLACASWHCSQET